MYRAWKAVSSVARTVLTLARLSATASSHLRWTVRPVAAMPMASKVMSGGPQGGADGGRLDPDRLGGEPIAQHGVDVRQGLGVEVDVVPVEPGGLQRPRHDGGHAA